MGERRGGNIAGHNGSDERGGRRVMHVDFFTRASCRYGERCIISHLTCWARYSLKSLKTYTPHTCSYFKVH